MKAFNSGAIFCLKKALFSRSVNSRTLFAYQRALFGSGKLFTHDHEWVAYDATKKEGKIGITNYAQGELGDIVHIDLPNSSKSFSKGDSIGALESVKTSAEIYAPLTGEVLASNDELKANPALVNEDAENKGWIVKVKVNNEKELESLMNEEQYKEFLTKQKH